MFEDSRLNIFVTVIKEGSFTKAAKSLGISQPAVSQNIVGIERELGIQLFERTRSELKLTEDGERFRQYAEQILYWYSSAAEAFRKVSVGALFKGGGKKKTIRIGISGNYNCFLVPGGTGDVDIDIADRDGSMSVTVNCPGTAGTGGLL